MDHPIILAIDFDGTIVHNAYPEIGELKPNVKRVLDRLNEEGFYMIMWTCRSGKAFDNAKKFVEENELPLHLYNESYAPHIEMYGSDTRKVGADIYIDDKQLGGIPDDWSIIYHLIHNHVSNFKLK